MAVGTGITEIADSEEEPLTSSPVVVSDAAADKLSTTPGQDAQAVAWLDQDPARSIANEALSRTDGLDVDQGESPSNVETAPADHIDLQPALQTATNIAGVCMTENPKQVAISAPQDSVAAFGADNYTGKVHIVGTEGEDSAAQATAHSPGTGYSLQHDEHMSLSTDTQGKWKGHQKDNPTLAEHLSDSPINTASESRQESFSPEEEARGNLATILKSRVNDSAHLVSDQQDIGQGDTAMGHVIKAGNDDGETSTAQTQHAMALASPIRPPVSMATKQMYSNDDTNTPVTPTGDTLNYVGLGHLPADTDSTTPQTNSNQSESGVFATKPDDRKVLENPSSHSLTTCTTALVPSPSDERTSSELNCRISGSNDLSRTAADESTAADTHGPHAERQASIDAILRTGTSTMNENDNYLKQATAELPTEQSLEKGHMIKESCLRSEMEQVSEPTIQSGIANVHPHREDENKVGIESSSTSTAPATHAQSQPSVSQTSEPASPRSVARLTPQEITLAELKAQKAALLASLGSLPAIQMLIEENQTSDNEMSDDDGEPTEADITAAANKMVKEYIKLLHEYNELKDVGQGLMGLIADQRGVRIVEIQDEFGLDAND